MRLTTLLSFFVLLVMASCKKYEEGPCLSLKSKKERISNTWTIEKATQNSEVITSKFDGWKITMTKEGYLFFFSTGKNSTQPALTGKWEFTDSKEKLKVIYSDPEGNEIVESYDIIKLKENALWLRQAEDQIYLQLIPS